MSSHNDNWQDCEAGLIDNMVARGLTVQRQQSRRGALRAIAMGGVACLSGVGVYSLVKLNGSRQAPANLIACEQVHERLQDFVDNKIDDKYLRGLISRHLFQCSSCEKAYRGMINGADFDCSVEVENQTA